MDWHKDPPKIGIVGAGFSGLCAAIQIQKQLKIDSFVMCDENEDVGGTWLVNTYPGCACDVASHLYSYSFEPNPNWSKVYSGQQEIWEYLRNVAKKHDLYSKIKFQARVLSAEWDETISKWRVKALNLKTGEEEVHIFDIVISGIGALRTPNFPQQFEPFAKPKMHSAQWDASIDLDDKVVAIIGSGASAVQIIPEIVDKVKKLIVYQRKPATVIPRIQTEFPELVKWTFANIPGVQWALRNLIFWSNEILHPAFKFDHLFSHIAVKLANFQLTRQVADPELRQKLRPNYKFGCKRVTPSNEYYPAMCKPNVEIITSNISEVTKDQIKTDDGTSRKPDVLILGTGFKVQDYFAPLVIKAKGGQDLLQKWKANGPNAYAGIVSSDTPNAFFILGPNTGLGHNTIIFAIECQVNWTVQVIQEMMKKGAKTVTIKKGVEDKYMAEIMEAMKSTVWGATDCGSWYADHRGVITALWPKNLISYYNRIKTVDCNLFEFE